MSFELTMLLVAVVLLFATLALQGALVPITHGFGWGLGARDDPKQKSVLQGRLDRTVANSLEGLALFAPLVLIANAIDLSNTLTVWGAGLYVAGRAGFVVCYLAGIPVLRSAMWGLAVAGLVTMAVEIMKIAL